MAGDKGGKAPVGVARSTATSSLRIMALPDYLIMAKLPGERVNGDWLVTGRREKWRPIFGLGAGRSGATRSAPALSAGAAAGACRARRRTGRWARSREFR